MCRYPVTSRSTVLAVQAFGELHFCDMEELFVSHVPLSCKFISRTIEASQLKNICDFKASGEELYYRHVHSCISVLEQHWKQEYTQVPCVPWTLASACMQTSLGRVITGLRWSKAGARLEVR